VENITDKIIIPLFLSLIMVYALMPITSNTLGPDGRRQKKKEREGKKRRPGDRARARLMYICHALLQRMPVLLSWL